MNATLGIPGVRSEIDFLEVHVKRCEGSFRPKAEVGIAE